jgi:hypothetical protein
MLAVALGPADRLDGRTLCVELLMTEWHRAFSLSIPIPIATPTPIALRRCLDSIVLVIHEPLQTAWQRIETESARQRRQAVVQPQSLGYEQTLQRPNMLGDRKTQITGCHQR